MTLTHCRSALLVLALSATLPLFAGKIGNDITVPAAGFVDGNGVSYRTELVLTNHRDVMQYVSLSFIQDGYDSEFTVFPLNPRETKFLPSAGFPTGGGMTPRIGALRIRTKSASNGNDDGLGKLEANAFIVAERGRFGKDGSSRQEVAAIASDEYTAEDAVFLGVRHKLAMGAYTNVGVTNMYAEPVTFYVQFQNSEPVALEVPAFSLRQIRVPGEGSDGRFVHVYPEWSIGESTPAERTPWVAYASTVDMHTGDAYSGMRIPSTTRFPGIDSLSVTTAAVAAVSAETTLPVVGYVDAPNDLIYRTELVVTNHRDAPQTVRFELIANGEVVTFKTLQMGARETQYLNDAGFTADFRHRGFIGALRLTAIQPDGSADSAGQLEANAFIVGERALGARGSTRQEIAGIAPSEYQPENAVFLGVRHSEGTGAYTNVGIVNLHPTQTETFYVRFQYSEPVAVTVPPLSLRQIRLPGAGHGGRYVHVYPEWSLTQEAPPRTTPWVAYASTVDVQTGDAFSGMRVPTDTSYDFPELD